MRDNIAVFSRYDGRYILIHIEEGRAQHIFVYRSLSDMDIGTVINCRIDSHAPGIDSCFAAYAPGEVAFVSGNYKCGSLIPLMYKKEAYGDKKPLFTDKISIVTDHVIVTANSLFVKASSKIPKEEKGELIKQFADISKERGIGILLRTKVYTHPDGIQTAFKQIDEIKRILDGIYDSAQHLTQYSVLYRPLPAYINDCLYLADSGISEIVTDDSEIYDKLSKEYIQLSRPVNLSDRVGLRFYGDKLLGLCKLYSFDAKISEALSRKVYLKSGAYITIDTTEALTAIDVNSGKENMKTSKEDTFLDINIEASREIARQLRIRNISGMILVDYINMAGDESYAKLEECIRHELSKDHISCRFIDFTALGLCEIVRLRSGSSLYNNMRG